MTTTSTASHGHQSLSFRLGSLALGTLFAAILGLTTGPALGAPAPILKSADAIPNRYIVVLKEGVTRRGDQTAVDGPSVRELAGNLALRHNGALRHTFELALKGFAVQMSPEQAAALAEDSSIAYIAEDAVVRGAGTQIDPPSWGLDRIDQTQLPLDATFAYANTASNVDVYVIDSGVRSTHQEFGGRVDTVHAFTAIQDGLGTEDCNGHGTIVAGIVGGATYGVAKGVSIHPVRVLSCDGWGSSSDLVAAVDWVTLQFQTVNPTTYSRKGVPTTVINRPMVANISLEMMKLQPIDDAVRASIAAGVTYVVASGNDAWDACAFSPSGVTQAITVSASNSDDHFYLYSNGGSCVDLVAPGVAIPSAFNGSDSDIMAMTGTSAAAPFVAGTAALYLAANPTAKPADVQAALAGHATANLLTEVPAGTANLLLYSGFAGLDAAPVASFTFTCKSSRSCTFDGTRSTDDRGIASWSWSFGTGATASGSKVSYRFPTNSTSFLVTLTVIDTAGQSATAQQTVRF